MSMLEVKDLHVSYGAIKAVQGISFEMEQGETVALIGSNGAGNPPHFAQSPVWKRPRAARSSFRDRS